MSCLYLAVYSTIVLLAITKNILRQPQMVWWFQGLYRAGTKICGWIQGSPTLLTNEYKSGGLLKSLTVWYVPLTSCSTHKCMYWNHNVDVNLVVSSTGRDDLTGYKYQLSGPYTIILDTQFYFKVCNLMWYSVLCNSTMLK